MRADMPAPPQLAWWLVPAVPAHQHFQSVIDGLASRLHGPAFEPHLTLALSWLPGEVRRVSAGWQVFEGADLAALAGRLAAALRPVVLSPDGLGHSPAYFRSIFLRMAAQPAEQARLAGQVDVLAEELARFAGRDRSVAEAPGSTAAPAFAPHLSLFYGELPEAQRETVVAGLAEGQGDAARLDLPAGVCGRWQTPVCFDTLVAVRPRRGARGFDRVADWDVFLRVRLTAQGGGGDEPVRDTLATR